MPLFSTSTMPSPSYEAVPPASESEEDVESSFEDEKLLLHHRSSPVYWRVLGPVAWLFTTFLLIVLLVVAVAALTKEPTEKQCAERLTVWSPAFEAVEVVDVQFQNSFMEKSIYRGPPTIEREKAWLDLWDFGPINVPYDKLDVLNKSSEVEWKRTKPEAGGGVIGSLEVFHHLHCLDLIRRYTYRDHWDYSKSPAWDGTPQQILNHVDHCINSLRLLIQCKADIDLYLVKVDTRTPLGIDPDFNTKHKCVNFEKIHQWAKEHELDTSQYQNDLTVSKAATS
ncbi:hypothetical protein F5Y14DRAFT_395268 [Nemania sp. NC0429]|nr:hypothetical protein F5Y14DRAFT_395268 [Nemania sp. NC0429]